MQRQTGFFLIRIALVVIYGGICFDVLPNLSFGGIVAIIGAIVSILWTYLGEREGCIEITLRLGSPSQFVVRNPGTTKIRDIKIVVPELKSLQRDFDDVPKILIPGAQFPISAGLSLGRSHQYEFQVSWRCGLVTKKRRQMKVPS